MADTLAQKAFGSANTDAFASMAPKARLEAFAWEYCKTVADASDDDISREAEALGVDVARLSALSGLVSAERAKILAEVLRIFGDRETSRDGETGLDRLLDDVLGTSGFEGTIPG